MYKIPTSKIIKFGKNGMALVLPPEYVKERNLKIGETVELVIFDKKEKLEHFR